MRITLPDPSVLPHEAAFAEPSITEDAHGAPRALAETSKGTRRCGWRLLTGREKLEAELPIHEADAVVTCNRIDGITSEWTVVITRADDATTVTCEVVYVDESRLEGGTVNIYVRRRST